MPLVCCLGPADRRKITRPRRSPEFPRLPPGGGGKPGRRVDRLRRAGAAGEDRLSGCDQTGLAGVRRICESSSKSRGG